MKPSTLFVFTLLIWTAPGYGAPSMSPMADMHLHWKWNQKEITTVEQAVGILQENNIHLALVTGTPPELALELAEAAPDVVVPIYGIYRLLDDWSRWHHDPRLLGRVRKALDSGKYRGIGEVHMIGGFISDWKNPVISGLFKLAAEYQVPVLVHTEFSRANYVIGFCESHPKTVFLWAHAGSMLSASEVARALDACPNLWAEFSARDPWRHLANLITKDGVLKPEWRQLMLDYVDRIMVGSDSVWPVEQLNPWNEADSGWQELGRFIEFHRGWLKNLPPEVARKIRLENAQRLFSSRR